MGPQSPSGLSGEEKILLHSPGLEPRNFQPVAYRLRYPNFAAVICYCYGYVITTHIYHFAAVQLLHKTKPRILVTENSLFNLLQNTELYGMEIIIIITQG